MLEAGAEPKVTELFCAPGNAGIAKGAKCIDIGAEDIDGIRDFAVKEGIDLAVIGPEVPLAMGITDRLEEAGVRTFGPNMKCSQLEASKSFTKEFCKGMAYRLRDTESSPIKKSLRSPSVYSDILWS